MTEPIYNLDENNDLFDTLYPPLAEGYTIYGKSNCPKCVVLKEQLSSLDIEVKYINCDEYLSTDKEKFKKIMFKYMNLEYKENGINLMYFPTVFYNGKFMTKYYNLFR